MKIFLKLYIYISLICAFLVTPLFAISEHYASFTEWGSGARSLGMGRAYVGLSNDASGLFWNPAGVMQMNSMQAMFQMAMLYQSYSMMYGAFALPGVDSAIGLEFMMLGGSEIEGRDRYNQLTGMVTESKMAVGLMYARRVLQNTYLGLKGKYYMRALGDYGDMAIGGDISILYNVSNKFSIGWNLLNVFGMVLGDTSDQLVSNGMFGMSYREKSMIFSIDTRDNFNEWHVGVEWLLIPLLPLRIGVNNDEVSFGGGIKLGILDADVAYVMNELEGKLGFSINLNFGKSMDEMARDEVEKTLQEAKELLNSDYFYMAKQKFEYILSFDPSREEINVVLERLEKALPFVESSLEVEKMTWEKFKRAKQLFNQGRYRESERLFQDVKKTNPNNRFVIYYLDEISIKK